MDGHQLTARLVAAYEQHLRVEERSAGTIEKYLRDVRAFQLWLGRGRVDNIKLVEWKSYLMLRRYAPVTINSMLAAVNSLCRFLGWNDCHVKYLKVQRRLFRESARELTKAENQPFCAVLVLRRCFVRRGCTCRQRNIRFMRMRIFSRILPDAKMQR